ncbi:MAG: tRNA pseudouridine(13) synthase TruD [Thermoprotei archaeon]
MTVYPVDLAVGIERYYIWEDWDAIEASIQRPEGFVVVEEVDFSPCTDYRAERHGRYAVFLMKKKGIDHFTAISRVQSVLKREVNYAGIKDANAVTYQLVYVDTMGNPPELTEWSDSSIELKFLGFMKGKFNHTGNRFEITLDVRDDLLGELEERVEKVATIGELPAFIGYQRFGTRRPTTHMVGKKLVQRDWCGAVDYIVGKPFPTEGEVSKKFRELYDKGELKEALEAVPKKFYQERAVLKALIETGDCFSALKASRIPLTFYVEAFQAYLFNRCLSENLDYKGNVIVVPNRYDPSDPLCRKVFLSEAVENLSVPELKIKIGKLERPKMMRVRNLRIKGRTLSFSLDRGMYATILLREILRADPLKFT